MTTFYDTKLLDTMSTVLGEAQRIVPGLGWGVKPSDGACASTLEDIPGVRLKATLGRLTVGTVHVIAPDDARYFNMEPGYYGVIEDWGLRDMSFARPIFLKLDECMPLDELLHDILTTVEAVAERLTTTPDDA